MSDPKTAQGSSMVPMLIGIAVIVIIIVVAVIGWAMGWFSGDAPAEEEEDEEEDEEKEVDDSPVDVDPNGTLSTRVDQLVTAVNDIKTSVSTLSKQINNTGGTGGGPKAYFHGRGYYRQPLPGKNVVKFDDYVSGGGITYSSDGILSGFKAGKAYEISMYATLFNFNYAWAANFMMQNGDGSKDYMYCRVIGYGNHQKDQKALGGGVSGCIIKMDDTPAYQDLELRFSYLNGEPIEFSWGSGLVVKEL